MGIRDGAPEGLVIEIGDAADVLGFESQWRDLARRSSPHTMAQTFEWALTAVEFDLAEKRRCFLVIVRDGERWSAVLGLTLHRDVHRSLRPFSAGSHEEYSGPLLEAGRERVLADKILALATSIPADRLMLYNLTAGHATDLAADALPLPQSVQALQAYVSRHARYATWDEAEKELSGGDRRDLRRYVRRLQEADPEAKVFCGWSRSVGDARESLDFTLAQKRRWLVKTKKTSRWLSDDRVIDFFKRLVDRIDPDKFPIVAEIRLGSKIVASAICLQSETSLIYLVNAFDDEFRKCSPTKVLIKYLIGYAIDSRRDFDFCVTLADYKAEWPVEIKDCYTRAIYMSALGRIPTPSEMKTAARKRLGGLRRRLTRQRPASR